MTPIPEPTTPPPASPGLSAEERTARKETYKLAQSPGLLRNGILHGCELEVRTQPCGRRLYSYPEGPAARLAVLVYIPADDSRYAHVYRPMANGMHIALGTAIRLDD